MQANSRPTIWRPGFCGRNWYATGSSFDAQAEEHDPPDWVHTPRLVIAVPRVIRLLRYSGRPQREVRLTRRNIHARDLGRCHYCGQRFPSRELTVDHVIPRSLGGRDTWENLVTAWRAVQLAQGQPHPAGRQHASASHADQATHQPHHRAAPEEPQVPRLAAVRRRVLHPPRRRRLVPGTPDAGGGRTVGVGARGRPCEWPQTSLADCELRMPESSSESCWSSPSRR